MDALINIIERAFSWITPAEKLQFCYDFMNNNGLQKYDGKFKQEIFIKVLNAPELIKTMAPGLSQKDASSLLISIIEVLEMICTIDKIKGKSTLVHVLRAINKNVALEHTLFSALRENMNFREDIYTEIPKSQITADHTFLIQRYDVFKQSLKNKKDIINVD